MQKIEQPSDPRSRLVRIQRQAHLARAGEWELETFVSKLDITTAHLARARVGTAQKTPPAETSGAVMGGLGRQGVNFANDKLPVATIECLRLDVCGFASLDEFRAILHEGL